MKVLITGGVGYIGSTIASALIDNHHTPIILDSLITGCEKFKRDLIFYKGDIANKTILEKIFNEHPDITHTIHCAALTLVPESVERPFDYYRENVAKSLDLFQNLKALGYNNIVYSSSASVYDDVPGFMVTEESPINPRSPYARTKFMTEMILKDFCNSYDMRGIALRYFNTIGADPKMRTGPYIKTPSHVLGKLIKSTANKNDIFNITGTDWPTKDGSGIRDFIHVWDLAMAHVKAIENFNNAFDKSGNKKYLIINIGTGNGVTVKELVAAFEKVFGKKINKQGAPPRPGDVAGSYANTDTAKKLIDWQANLSIKDGISDALKWDNFTR